MRELIVVMRIVLGFLMNAVAVNRSVSSFNVFSMFIDGVGVGCEKVFKSFCFKVINKIRRLRLSFQWFVIKLLKFSVMYIDKMKLVGTVLIVRSMSLSTVVAEWRTSPSSPLHFTHLSLFPQFEEPCPKD